MAVVVVNAASKYSEPIMYSFNGGYVYMKYLNIYPVIDSIS